MKERIVIKDEFWVKHFQEREKDFYEEDMCSGGNPEEWWHYKKEQVPESFAELKILFLDKLKELNVMWYGDRFVENKSEEFWVKGILFKADKTLSIRDDNDNIRVIMTNIDYPLMWLLIQTTLNIKSNHLF